MKKYDLDERMINFSVSIIKLAEKLPKTIAGQYFANQLIRSASSAALNYAEAQSGESRRDFVHKLMIALKELRETSSGLRIVDKSNLYSLAILERNLLKENNELISIFMQSIKTAKKNMN
ncbi:MAG: four helix bundle protein [Bacteroidales bacterium]|nr:four helix bundle protein [Bacteroidales bacterium]